MKAQPADRVTAAHPRPGYRTTVAALVAVLIVAAAVLPSAPASAVNAATPVEVAAVDELVRAELAKTPIPGAAVALTRGDETLLVRGYGHDSLGAPITGDTLFRIASLSKSFTSLAVLQLVDAGRLSLDDRVVEHLPQLRLADPRGAEITVRELLDHTSGLADHTFSDLDRAQPTTTAAAVAGMSSARLVATPGTRWNYHNPNYHLAARIVEVLSGQTFNDYLRDHVFAPTGMDASSATTMSTDPVAGLARGHATAYGVPIPTEGLRTFETGAGGVVSTAENMAHWLIVHATGGQAADGTRIVSPDSMRALHTGNARFGYALGWDTEGPVNAPTVLQHSGNLLTYSAFQAVLPGSGYGVALLFNSASALLLEQSAIFDGVLDVLDGAGGDSPVPQLSSTEGDAVLGSATVAVLLLGIRGVLVSRRWVARHGSSAPRVILRMLPVLGLATLLASFPQVAERMYGGRSVTWLAAAYAWPALVALVGAALACTVATCIARAAQLGRSLRGRGGRKA